MKKMSRNLAIMIALGLGYLFAGNKVSTNGAIVVFTVAIVTELMEQLLGCFSELELQSRTTLSESKKDQIRKERLVLRDTVFTFVISYLLLTSPFGLVGYLQAVPFLAASIIPAVVAAVISKAARMSEANFEVKADAEKIAA